MQTKHVGSNRWLVGFSLTFSLNSPINNRIVYLTEKLIQSPKINCVDL